MTLTPRPQTSSPSASGRSATAAAIRSASSSGPALDPCDAVQRLAELGAWGVNFHDNDLVPIDATPAERDRIVARLPPRARRDGHDGADGDDQPVHRSGVQGRRVHVARPAASAPTRCRRRCARWISAWSWARSTYVFWGGREGAEVDAGKDPIEAIKRFRDAHRLPVRVRARPALRPAVRARSQAERAARRHLLPHHRGVSRRSSTRWRTRRWSASTRRSRTSRWPGLNFYHVVAQALEAGKLFHIDLNDQKPGRFDQDLRFGSESIKPLFFLVKLLEESGYDGPRHFDAHAYRTEDDDGVWDFAARLHAHLPDPQGEGAAVRAHTRDSGAARRDSRRRRRSVEPPTARAARPRAEGAQLRSPGAGRRAGCPTSGSISSSSICCSASA